MDQIAAQAAVSKQTGYKQFADKERLFAEVVLGVTGTVDGFVDVVERALGHSAHVEHDLHELARTYVRTVVRPDVLRMRRLLIGQASRFPELGRAYYERGPERVIAAIAACFEELMARGLLRAGDPLLAAQHYAFLVLAIPLDRALVCGDDQFSPAQLDSLAESGVEVFLRAYGLPGDARGR